MNKKVIIGLVVLVAIIILVVFKFPNLFKKSESSPPMPATEMVATITQIKPNSIIVDGRVTPPNLGTTSSTTQINTKISEVIITPQTKLQKKVYIIPTDMRWGVTFTPETKLTEMTTKDLYVGMKIDLKTKEEVLFPGKLTAVNILYENIEYKK